MQFATRCHVSSELLRVFRKLCLLAALAASIVSVPALAQQTPPTWRSIGPFGGDARAFAAVPSHPEHLYLGNTNNWIFESFDAGATWARLSRVGGDDDLIVDSIVVDASDSKTIYAGVWRVDRPDGGLFASHDGGKTWKAIPALKGESVLALAQAPSDPAILVVGSLKGVYRTEDHGATWELISPPQDNPLSREIHEVESLAINPKNPEIIYAGTWHLPWKTTDGGKSWHNIKQGVIDDSDVFSIIVDPERPSTVYASACSGIYKSENAGELFKKIQGIPATARRTRVLMQDTHRREIVYAGTTEGLYRTRDGGREWQRLTGENVIVNDIYLDPEHAGHILLATDRGGVLASQDDGATFADSNEGFSARKVEALVADARDPRRILAGVVNDKSYGGVFLTTDGGTSWAQIAGGLEGRDVFTLAEAKDGTVLAGTNHGIFALLAGEGFSDPHWVMRSSIVNYGNKIVSEMVKGRKVNRMEKVTIPARAMSSRVAEFDLSGDTWIVATAEGIFTSTDKGVTWQGGLVLGSAEYHSVAVWDGEMLAARREGVVFSKDQGKSWDPVRLPSRVKDIRKVAFSKDGGLWIGAGDGVYFSRDFSTSVAPSWFWLEKVPIRDVGDLSFDEQTGRMLVSSRSSQVLYSVDPATLSFTGMATGFRLFLARSAGGVRFATSLQDGVLAEPPPAPVSAKQEAPAATKSSVTHTALPKP
jgi:photosystem II stability/assembly factor-like uncharacterized protein